MGTIHIDDKITDYVLGLLPEQDRAAVARHVAGCDACRAAVRREREIGRLVQGTLNKATAPDFGRLQSLMPPVPTKKRPVLALLAPYRQWAVACLLLVAMMGAFLFGGDGAYDLLTRPTANQPATISFVEASLTEGVGTTETMTTNEASTFFSISAEPTLPAEQSRTFVNSAPEPANPQAATLPVAPQVTPAPAATYFQ